MILELVVGFVFGVIVSAVYPRFPKFVRMALNKIPQQQPQKSPNEKPKIKTF